MSAESKKKTLPNSKKKISRSFTESFPQKIVLAKPSPFSKWLISQYLSHSTLYSAIKKFEQMIVLEGRLELPRDCSHKVLNLARIPISPPQQIPSYNSIKIRNLKTPHCGAFRLYIISNLQYLIHP